MTKLNPSQRAKVLQIKALKEDFDEVREKLETKHKLEIDLAKNPLRRAVEEALEEGIPARPIYTNGFSFSQVNSLTNFLKSPVAAAESELTALQQAMEHKAAVPESVTVDEAVAALMVGFHTVAEYEHGDRIKYTDEDGTEYVFATRKLGGDVVMILPGPGGQLPADFPVHIKQKILAEYPSLRETTYDGL